MAEVEADLLSCGEELMGIPGGRGRKIFLREDRGEKLSVGKSCGEVGGTDEA